MLMLCDLISHFLNKLGITVHEVSWYKIFKNLRVWSLILETKINNKNVYSEDIFKNIKVNPWNIRILYVLLVK